MCSSRQLRQNFYQSASGPQHSPVSSPLSSFSPRSALEQSTRFPELGTVPGPAETTARGSPPCDPVVPTLVKHRLFSLRCLHFVLTTFASDSSESAPATNSELRATLGGGIPVCTRAASAPCSNACVCSARFLFAFLLLHHLSVLPSSQCSEHSGRFHSQQLRTPHLLPLHRDGTFSTHC